MPASDCNKSKFLFEGLTYAWVTTYSTNIFTNLPRPVVCPNLQLGNLKLLLFFHLVHNSREHYLFISPINNIIERPRQTPYIDHD